MCVGFGLACGGFWSSVVVAGYEKRTIRVLPWWSSCVYV